ncbi:MAG: FAD-dependent oxidoreductase [Saprospiraceae bacterium]
MNEDQPQIANWTTCQNCQGGGKKHFKLKKRARLNYRRTVEEFEKLHPGETPPPRPKGGLYNCEDCDGSGLIKTSIPTIPDTENYPHLAIVGGGIGGVALAIACLHRGIPFTLYERDSSFDARSQGYGLTLQQASKAMGGFGIFSLDEGIISTRHLVHKTDGEVIGEWGSRKWLKGNVQPTAKRVNVHIARQALRLALLQQLAGSGKVQWCHQLVDFTETEAEGVTLNFQVDGQVKTAKADLLVGADGIRSTVRNLLIGEETTPLRYLGCIVILGICPLANLGDLESDLLDGKTVFQTANGNERIYMMPFSTDSVMWQLSFPMPEDDAKALSTRGPEALKITACAKTQWHFPVPEIMAATEASLISGYPVYDRELLRPELLENANHVTLIGDAAHPMSPFKGQGANQALLDALALARSIYTGCKLDSDWRATGLRESVLSDFETEMLERTAPKVSDSAAAVKYLHSDAMLWVGNGPRGRKA